MLINKLSGSYIRCNVALDLAFLVAVNTAVAQNCCDHANTTTA